MLAGKRSCANVRQGALQSRFWCRTGEPLEPWHGLSAPGQMARDEVPRRELTQSRLLAARSGRREGLERAAGAKPASRRGRERARRIAVEDDVAAAALQAGIGDDRGREERLGVRVLGCPEEVGAGCELDDLPEVHDADAVAEVLDRREVVGDEEAREAHAAGDRPEG